MGDTVNHGREAPTEVEQVVADILSGCPKVQLALLFGSVARGTARRDSDLDIAVAADRPLEASDKIVLMEGLALRFGRPVDLIDLQAAGTRLLNTVLSQGRLVLCRDKRLYAELIKRSVFDAADFLPYRDRILRARREAWIGR